VAPRPASRREREANRQRRDGHQPRKRHQPDPPRRELEPQRADGFGALRSVAGGPLSALTYVSLSSAFVGPDDISRPSMAHPADQSRRGGSHARSSSGSHDGARAAQAAASNSTEWWTVATTGGPGWNPGDSASRA
jgi:hypothetical protein